MGNKTIYARDFLLWVAVKERAYLEHMSMSALVEKALRYYLKHVEKESD